MEPASPGQPPPPGAPRVLGSPRVALGGLNPGPHWPSPWPRSWRMSRGREAGESPAGPTGKAAPSRPQLRWASASPPRPCGAWAQDTPQPAADPGLPRAKPHSRPLQAHEDPGPLPRPQKLKGTHVPVNCRPGSRPGEAWSGRCSQGPSPTPAVAGAPADPCGPGHCAHRLGVRGHRRPPGRGA